MSGPREAIPPVAERNRLKARLQNKWGLSAADAHRLVDADVPPGFRTRAQIVDDMILYCKTLTRSR